MTKPDLEIILRTVANRPPVVKNAQSNVTSGVWSVYVPPAPADPGP